MLCRDDFRGVCVSKELLRQLLWRAVAQHQTLLLSQQLCLKNWHPETRGESKSTLLFSALLLKGFRNRWKAATQHLPAPAWAAPPVLRKEHGTCVWDPSERYCPKFTLLQETLLSDMHRHRPKYPRKTFPGKKSLKFTVRGWISNSSLKGFFTLS